MNFSIDEQIFKQRDLIFQMDLHFQRQLSILTEKINHLNQPKLIKSKNIKLKTLNIIIKKNYPISANNKRNDVSKLPFLKKKYL